MLPPGGRNWQLIAPHCSTFSVAPSIINDTSCSIAKLKFKILMVVVSKSTICNGREPKSCLGQVFNSELDHSGRSTG